MEKNQPLILRYEADLFVDDYQLDDKEINLQPIVKTDFVKIFTG